MIGLLMASLVVFVVPHPDDEITLLDEIRAAGERAVVVVMTDGSLTRHCPRLGLDHDACVKAREASARGFMAERAPLARLVFAGEPDQGLTVEAVLAQIRLLCRGTSCEVWAAGTDYGHPDHTTVRRAVAAVGGTAYAGKLRHDDGDYRAAVTWYGWLGVVDSWRAAWIVGLGNQAWN